MIWRSPSNLALIKYWGKHGKQYPCNASISFTLERAYTEMELTHAPKAKDGQIALDFRFEGQPQPAFAQKIQRFLNSLLADEFPFLDAHQLRIQSHNSFPHSAGIASSASSMSALALCLCSMQRELGLGLEEEAAFWQKASRIARLGSGSACRSIFPVAGLWGKTPHWAAGSDDYAVGMAEELHPIFHDYRDAILLVSKQEKSVSSTAGHALMDGNPFAPVRYAQAQDNLGKLLPALKQGDLETFGQIVEEEALTLHALMMTSRPSYILLEPSSLALIQRIRAWRAESKQPLYFSIDAGPNLHLLYPAAAASAVEAFIEAGLKPYCQDGQYLLDRVGQGAVEQTEYRF
jgi:diphosphomevalonate decarboxylase